MANNDAEELLNLISDFVKGNIGSPDISMAKITSNGKPSQQLPPPIKTNLTLKEIAAQYPLITKSLKNFSGFHTASIFGSLLTLPELQGNSIRLQALSHLAVRFGKGNKPPTAANISTWFNQMDKGICGRLEDAAEDVFIGNAYDSTGNYRIFQGTADDLHPKI